MTQRCVLASHNPGKCQEMQAMFAEAQLPWQVVLQSEFGIGEVDETGTTFVENAIIKARHAAEVSGLPALADDSGLVVDALGGEPGVYAARYAGPAADFRKNTAKVLAGLGDEDQRQARFVSVLVWMRSANDPLPLVCEGVWEGVITLELCGDKGFGYDPIFYDQQYRMTAAEMDPSLKNRISHRARAWQQMVNLLRA